VEAAPRSPPHEVGRDRERLLLSPEAIGEGTRPSLTLPTSWGWDLASFYTPVAAEPARS
jgi:hypothetical protein